MDLRKINRLMNKANEYKNKSNQFDYLSFRAKDGIITNISIKRNKNSSYESYTEATEGFERYKRYILSNESLKSSTEIKGEVLCMSTEGQTVTLYGESELVD